MSESPDFAGDHPRLTDAQLARIERVAERRKVLRGDVLCQPDEKDFAFHVVLSGAVAIIGYDVDFRAEVSRLGA
ncbi:hypothetical protein [Rhizobium sp. ZX09]|uniref:hypothetical protein n=1 Tax=Rhizobium sp. ZX09 TaxID=2291939 RepID=UPI001A98E4B2|nr:hypothetical protein [Rhizobium sp. ZX09]QSZ59723.1 hypothetical protein BTN45_21540 [Rhizobium sp. ZX09]